MPNEDVYEPQVEGDKLHVLTGNTIREIYALIRRARPRTSGGGGLTTQERDDGTFLTNATGGNGGGGSGGVGLGPVVFAGTASGEVAYFLVNCDGTAYSSPPTRPDGSAYPIANPE